AEPTMPSTAPELDLQRPRVALCEPDPPLRALLGEWLQRSDFEPVRCAGDASADSVVLVVADVPAPRQDGAASIAALRQRFAHAKVLAISAQFMPCMHGSPSAAVELGADAVLAKPFAAKMFIDAVYRLMAS
ncbi:MAG: hypothetical protein ACHP83_21260, partial [Burkholderiales bacterium]